METNNEVSLNSDVQDLINVVNAYYPGTIAVTFIGNIKAGYVRHDQAQVIQDGPDMAIQIADLTEPNYTASHELIHMLMTLKGFPQIFFSLTTDNDGLDEQLQMMGTELYDIVSHFVVVDEQRKHNLIDDDIEEKYFKGIYATIKPEPTPIDDQSTIRLTTLLDALVFYGEHINKYDAQLNKDFPISYAAAKELYQVITEKPVDSPFNLRRNVVKLFKAFDDQLAKWDIPRLHNNEFVTIASVLSERQLGLKVNQVFEIYHSELKETNSNTRGYVGFNKVDGQNSFVIPSPVGKDNDPEFFKATYAKTVKELFDELQMPFILRK